MKIAVAGDSAGEGLAKVLADHLSGAHDVSEISRTDAGADAFPETVHDGVKAAGFGDGHVFAVAFLS